MRNHIAVKFLAILLCAASLLGTMGSILAIAVLTHLNLYNQSVDQMVDRRLKDNCQLYGNHLALGYASQTLGGCSEDMALERWPMVNINVRDASASLGYTLYDPEGQVLDSQNQALKESASVYTAQIGGQYMYLLSEKAESETLEETQPDEVQWDFTLENGESVYDAIPEEGAEVAAFLITYVNTAQGSVSHASTGAAGFAFRNSQGQVLCWFQENLALESGPVLQVVLQNTRGETVYQAAGESAVGELARGTNGGMIFTALSPVDQGVPEETGVPGDQMCLEETGAAVPESAEPAEETAPPTAPEGLQTQEVFVARFDDQEGNPVWEHSSPEAIGYVYLDETGCPAFVSYLPQEELPQDWLLPTTVNGVTLWNKDGERICELYAEGGAGTVYIGENGNMRFRSFLPGTLLPQEEPSSASAPVEAEEAPVTAPAQESAAGEATAAPEGTEAAEVTEATAASEAEAPLEATEVTVPMETAEATEALAMTESLPAEPALINGRPLTEYEIRHLAYFNSEQASWMEAEYVSLPLTGYTVEVYVDTEDLVDAPVYSLLRLVRGYRNDLFLILLVCVLVLAITVVYLCCAAGRKPHSDEVRAGGLNRLSLDVYGAGALGSVAVLGICILNGGLTLLNRNFVTGCGILVAMGFAACLICVGFGFACVAQGKTPGGYLWRNTLVVRLLVLCIRFCLGLEAFLSTRFLPWGKKAVLALWQLVRRLLAGCLAGMKNLCRRIGKVFRSFVALLPNMWQWLLAGLAVLVLLLLVMQFLNQGDTLIGFLCLAGAVGILIYEAYAYGILLDSAKRMRRGGLDTQVDRRRLVGSFDEFAQELDGLAGVAVVAAQKQLKSERMKTELITNVSHDIKTPLTSIINYVDLLQKPHSEEEEQMYLEVLARQANQLKKLIEDLIDMSKASTGNMTVDVMRLNAVESVNQALGEFADKLEKAQLQPVFRHSAESIEMMADGRLVWRVLSNLLSNAVKYALPGTRLYIDLEQAEGKVILSMKNISREELNIDADELIERFVRGDDARNTEGSGLGLNIAKSLMELQKGQLQLLVDGDLFKVTLVFPGV